MLDKVKIKKIVIIDDEEALCFFMSKNLKKTGKYKISYALSGKAGIKLVKKDQPDLVFLDIDLQDMDGLDIIHKIAKAKEGARIIVMTGKGTHEQVRKAFEKGAVDFAVKPCSTKKLVELIERHAGIKKRVSDLHIAKQTQATFKKTLFLDILTSFVSASEAKSIYLKGHSERVAELSEEIGAKLGLDKDQLEVLKCGALLHDVGKIGVKDAILEKNGKLTINEWADIKKHPVVGSEIINKVRLFRLEAPLVRSHHECFDGGGYPDGLKGNEIPLGARIITVADAYDAMRSRRVYRNKLTKEETVFEIKRGSGVQFDPDVVRVFLELAIKLR